MKFHKGKNHFWKSHRDPEFLGFQTRVILDLWGVPFHAMVVFGLVPDLLIKSTSGYCEQLLAGATAYNLGTQRQNTNIALQVGYIHHKYNILFWHYLHYMPLKLQL